MKLVIATPLYPPEIGGPATYAKLLFEGLPAKGIEVDLVKFSEVRHLPKFIRHFVYYLRVLRAARSADIVLALDPVSVGLSAMKAAQKAGKPFVVKIVGDYAWEQGTQRFGVTQNLDEFAKSKQASFFVRRLQGIQTRVAKAAVKIIVPSEYLKNIVLAWGIPAQKIQVIYNAVSIKHIGEIPNMIQNLPRPRVVTAARLVEWKGIDGLIRVPDGIWSARRKGLNPSLIIVGSGPEEKQLKEQVAQLGLSDVCVFTGQLSHEDTLAVMNDADIFVLNSTYEGLSHVLIEALVLGKCIVATNVGGNPEVILQGEGILINVKSETELASSLRILIEHQDKRLQFSKKAKESAKRFTVEIMIEKTASLLNSV